MLDAALSDQDMRRLVQVVTSNLVDSNVFVRGLLLTLNRHLRLDMPQEGCGEVGRRDEDVGNEADDEAEGHEEQAQAGPCGSEGDSYLLHTWCDIVPLPVSAPQAEARATVGSKPGPVPLRLVEFLSSNSVRLLRSLMSVVDLSNVSHESICVLNTAVVMLIFAHRRSVSQ